MIAVFASCNKESNLGFEILPSGDLITIRGKIIKDNITAFTFSETGIKTDETNKSLLGGLNDPLFGSTTADMAAQFRLIEVPDFGSNPSVDSLKLFLYYSGIYGDTLASQKFKIYELVSDLDVDAEYTQNVDLKAMASNELLGEREFIPRVRLDSASSDTLYQLVSVKLDNSLGEKLMAADPSQVVSNDAFVEYFKGLLIESQPVTETGGAMLSVEAAYSGNYLGSALLLYYSNDSTAADTSFVIPYLISPFSARVTRISHDYTGTPFYNSLDSENIEDSLIYVQASGGLKAKINIDGLSSWGDSVNTAINKAELIIQIDTVASQIDLFPPPSRLYFTYIDTIDVERLPADYYFSTDYYGGALNTNDYTYHFNITQHLQEIIDGKSNLGFYLSTGRVASQAKRVVLKGSTSITGIKLIVTYSKFNT
jgi:hypothetical protein